MPFYTYALRQTDSQKIENNKNTQINHQIKQCSNDIKSDHYETKKDGVNGNCSQWLNQRRGDPVICVHFHKIQFKS